MLHAHHCLAFALMGVNVGIRDFNLNREVPVTSSFTETGAQDLSGEPEFLTGSDPAEPWDLDPCTVELKRSSLDCKAFLNPSFLLELGVAGFGCALLDSPEEVGKGSANVSQGLVSNFPGHSVHPGELGGLEGIQLFVESLPTRLVPGFVLDFPMSQAPIERETCRTCTLGQERLLDVIRREPYALAKNHMTISLRTRRRTTSERDTSSRFASSLSHAKSGGSRWMSRRLTRYAFLGAAMNGRLRAGKVGVKAQLSWLSVNRSQLLIIIGELLVRRRV